MTAMIDTVKSADGTPIAFERRGAGPVVVVVAGAANDRHGDEPLVAELTAEFSVVTYDRRGRGDSGDTAPYAVEREIEDLAAVVASFAEPVIVHGISSGGALALLAAASGVPMARLSVFEPPYRAEAEEVPEGYADEMRALVAADRWDEAVTLFMTAAVGSPAEAVEEAKATPMWAELRSFAPTLVYEARVMGDSKVPAKRLASIATPVLVVNSSGSTDWLKTAALLTTKAIPGAKHVQLDGEFHDVPAGRLAPELGAFYRDPR
ncbi:hydrolase [Amycolatopsis regifaucium]|uniref:Hydrolase n=2 Tax=Amycolatopsis regifaucium TaxID=546365 RepID=A0A154M6G8_9PSEU|nr:hydrolase [Amycolatopsis regifaucium]OKA07631.1 hydrolase [Amycolatopsis regifaucium]SFH06705.1 Lysophospholipase, alpha-beta hydrolase superfamily [Amycolatopsis regifaucium]